VPFINALPEWNKQGVEPPQSLKDGGWQAQQKPPADYFNWFQHTTYKALEEIRVYLDNLEVTPSWDDIEGKPTAFQPTSHTHTKDEVGLSNVDNVQQASKTEFMSHLAEYMPHDSELNQYASAEDANGIYTIVEFKRPNGTLYLKSTLSNADTDDNYQTCTWDFYKSDGITVGLTKQCAITYIDGIPVNKEWIE
jgi:hypothetical protein